jgi:undecaprenyl-diphosphatase
MSFTKGLRELLNRLAALDTSLSACLTLTGEAGWQRTVAVLGAHLGDAPLWFVIAVIAFGLGDKETKHFVLLTAVAVIVAGGLTTFLKFRTRRNRPQERSGLYSTKYDPYSFPSGHATRLACQATVFSHQFPQWAIVSYALTLFVALCRVALGIHYISDILVGLAIGSLASVVIVSIL